MNKNLKSNLIIVTIAVATCVTGAIGGYVFTKNNKKIPVVSKALASLGKVPDQNNTVTAVAETDVTTETEKPAVEEVTPTTTEKTTAEVAIKNGKTTPSSTTKPSTTTPKPSTPVVTPPNPVPAKTSGIDWEITNKIRNSNIGNKYNGLKTETFNQILLDVVNGKRTISNTLSEINKLTWVEKCIDPSISTSKVTYHIGQSLLTVYSTKSSQPELITSGAVKSGKFPTTQYRQEIVYYDAASKDYKLYTLGINFIFEQNK
jgi:uncharacterized membrane protein